jgi:hypothetical protein
MEGGSDDDEQASAELMEYEADADAAEDEEYMQILTFLAGMCARNEKSRHGGSARGHRKWKPSQRMEGYCMLYADYFADDPFHDATVFRHHFRMSRPLFRGIVEAERAMSILHVLCV